MVPSLWHTWCPFCQLILSMTLVLALSWTPWYKRGTKVPGWALAWRTTARNDWSSDSNPVLFDFKARHHTTLRVTYMAAINRMFTRARPRAKALGKGMFISQDWNPNSLLLLTSGHTACWIAWPSSAFGFWFVLPGAEIDQRPEAGALCDGDAKVNRLPTTLSASELPPSARHSLRGPQQPHQTAIVPEKHVIFQMLFPRLKCLSPAPFFCLL